MTVNLDGWFQMQDRVVASNRAEFEREYKWIAAALGLLSDMQAFVNTDPRVVEPRSSQLPTEHLAANVVVNLVNDAMGSLINATRLLLFGAHADAFALVRSAFEACCHAEYFAFQPQRAEAYVELEHLITETPGLNLRAALRKRNLQFGSILSDLEQRDGEDRRSLYAQLCNFGAHPSPVRVGLRLSAPGGAVMAAVSVSTPEWSRASWTQGCATDLMAVVKYAFELLPEHYDAWFAAEVALEERRRSLVQEYQALQG